MIDDPIADVAEEAEEQAIDAAPVVGGFDWAKAALILAVLILPIVIGNWLARRLKMPDYGWKISLVLTSIAVGVLCVTTGEFKGGTDLSGGLTLIYEIADKDRIAPKDDQAPPAQDEDQQKVQIGQVINALKMRVDPAGTKEVSIRPYGENIEVIIPKASGEELEYVKRLLTDLGELEFRITASRLWPADRPKIEAARSLPPNQKDLVMDGQVVARWVGFDDREFGDGDNRLEIRQAGSRQEALVLVDPLNVTGEFLTSAISSNDQNGRPSVSFRFNAAGSARFGKLTGDNLPNATTNTQRNLGILLDDTIISAPFIKSKITSQGEISGGTMTREEVDRIVAVLEAGSLPAALNKTPISEETISATIGQTTIEKGAYAITVSLIAVLVFVLFYYRFAGFVACLALALNLLLVLALMVLFGAAFTLPGLAGLVLTIGMSVDANVLIFERIREEMDRGASLRMAIRNGFDRATTTIVDANVTTLITGIVLYWIGTDQVRGFAVTLILGILMSMFTAIFCSRLVFDIAERKRWIKSLNFSQIIGKTNIDFIGMRGVAAAFSLILIAVGLVGVFGRSSGLLDIDFTGGTSVTQVLVDGAKMDTAEVRAAIEKTDLADKNLSVNERGTTGNRFTIRSSVEEVGVVKQVLRETFGDQLLKNALQFGEVQPFSDNGFEGTEVQLTFNEGPGYGDEDGLSHDALVDRIETIVEKLGHKGLDPVLDNPDYTPGTSQRFKQWNLRLGNLSAEETTAVVQQLQSNLAKEPIFPLANKIGGKVASGMQKTAIEAILVSLIGIVAYIWFRFQNVAFGLAAVVALVHDVLVTLGAVAVSAYIVRAVPGLATALQLESFQISLTMVAAFLTIIGYSLNDTIVIFDRVREVRGKSPKLTAEMINASVNQTLSRTLLTSLTTLIVVAILYFFGGPGIHGFAFALTIGVVVGTYSTVFIACPALLAMVGTSPEPVKASDPKSNAA